MTKLRCVAKLANLKHYLRRECTKVLFSGDFVSDHYFYTAFSSVSRVLLLFSLLRPVLWDLRGESLDSFLLFVVHIKRPLKNWLRDSITRISVTPATITGFLRLCGLFSRFKVSPVRGKAVLHDSTGLRGTKANASPCIFMKTGLQANLFNFSVIARPLAPATSPLREYSLVWTVKEIDLFFAKLFFLQLSVRRTWF